MARMLLKIAGDPESGLAPWLDTGAVTRAVQDYAGHALADQRYRQAGQREIDFLELGCAKKP